MKVIPGDLQHRFVVMNLVKKKAKKVVKKEAIERRRFGSLGKTTQGQDFKKE